MNTFSDEVFRITQQNAPQYIRYLYNLQWKEKSFKPNFKKHTRQRAKIIGNTIYLDSNFETIEKRNEVALHELAHYISNDKYGLRNNPHDDYFFLVLNELNGKDIRYKYDKMGVMKLEK